MITGCKRMILIQIMYAHKRCVNLAKKCKIGLSGMWALYNDINALHFASSVLLERITVYN